MDFHEERFRNIAKYVFKCVLLKITRLGYVERDESLKNRVQLSPHEQYSQTVLTQSVSTVGEY